MAGGQANDPRRDFRAMVIAKAARDAAFREELLRDPEGAAAREISAATGSAVPLPAHVRVFVHEETADTFHLVLPPVPAAGEISDAELSALAGGNNAGVGNSGDDNVGFWNSGNNNAGFWNTGAGD